MSVQSMVIVLLGADTLPDVSTARRKTSVGPSSMHVFHALPVPVTLPLSTPSKNIR